MFSKEDPKFEYAMTSLDPRIHFALVCGAKVVVTSLYMYIRAATNSSFWYPDIRLV